MITRTEAERLAHMANALRPDWPITSLTTFIWSNLKPRAYRDIAVALAWAATDFATKTPARVLESGPWWQATKAQTGTLSAITRYCPEHPDEKAWSCTSCALEVAPDPVAGLAAVREQLAAAKAEARAARDARQNQSRERAGATT